MRRKWLSTVLAVALAASFINAPCGGKDDGDDTTLLLGLFSLQSLMTLQFSGSCNKTTSCVNYFGVNPGLSSCTGTLSTTARCPTANSIGSCRGSNSEEVYYTGQTFCTDDSTCQSSCTSLTGGTYNANYTGQ